MVAIRLVIHIRIFKINVRTDERQKQYDTKMTMVHDRTYRWVFAQSDFLATQRKDVNQFLFCSFLEKQKTKTKKIKTQVFILRSREQICLNRIGPSYKKWMVMLKM